MRGGSRYGAGRPGWNGKVENLLKIDIRQWVAEGNLIPGNFLSYSWSREGEKIASIGVQVNSADSLTLKYSWHPDGQESAQDIAEHVDLTHTACNYGGSRVTIHSKLWGTGGALDAKK